MSDLVREFFPYVPEGCQECPGLENAADKIAADFRVVGVAAVMVIETEGADGEDTPSHTVHYPRIAEAFTEVAVERLSAARSVVGKLISACETGVIVTPVEKPQLRRKRQSPVNHASISCGSAAIEAYFVGRSTRVSS